MSKKEMMARGTAAVMVVVMTVAVALLATSCGGSEYIIRVRGDTN